jgi:hypothetical protein
VVPRVECRHAIGPEGPPVVAEPSQLLPLIDISRSGPIVIVGDGAAKHRQAIDAWSDGAWQIVDPPTMLAIAIGMLGRRLAARGLAGAPHALQPLYVRRPDAELERERRTP